MRTKHTEAQANSSLRWVRIYVAAQLGFTIPIYSQLSLSRLRLSRITAYLEMKIWSLFQHVNLTTGNKILRKRGEIAPNFYSFPQYFQCISKFRIQITYLFVKCGCLIYFFLNSANRTDIWKYFKESLGLRDNESRLYLSST